LTIAAKITAKTCDATSGTAVADSWTPGGIAMTKTAMRDRVAGAGLDSKPEGRGGHLMISSVPGAPGRARVIGSLTGDSVQLLLDAVNEGVAELDLSEISQIDHQAVRVMTMLSPQRCTLLRCPRWLELWLARMRRNEGD
jgi:hypothetical protein